MFLSVVTVSRYIYSHTQTGMRYFVLILNKQKGNKIHSKGNINDIW